MIYKNFIQGMQFFFKGFFIFKQKKIRRYVYLPLLINLLLYGGLFYFGLSTLVEQLYQINLPFHLHWLNSIWPILKWLVIITSSILLCLILAFISTLLANWMACPFNGKLSEQVEFQITQQPIPSEPTTKLIIRSLKREGLKLRYYLPKLVLATLLSLIFSFVPVLNTLTPLIWFGLGAWMFSLQYLDYPSDNHLESFNTLKNKLKQTPMITLGFGTCVTITSAIPFINLCVMPIAVTGATFFWLETFKTSEV